MKITCPMCDHELEGRIAVFVPKEQIITMKLKTENEMVSAKTIGGVITNTEQLLVSIAKDIGGMVSVFVKSIKTKPGEIAIEFCVLDVSGDAAAKTHRGLKAIQAEIAKM